MQQLAYKLAYTRAALLAGLALAAGPAVAQTMLSGGYQVGRYTSGLYNLDAWSLELNRSANQVLEPMRWTNTFQGVAVRLTVLTEGGLGFGLGYNNRHTITESRYLTAAKAEMRAAYRVRLNELNLETSYALWRKRLRPGASLDFGLFNFDRRDAVSDDFKGSEWHSFHNGDPSVLSSGTRSATVGATVFADVVLLGGKYGGGLTLRPYAQWQLLTASMFGKYGTRDEDSYDYYLSNYGVVASWAFVLAKPSDR